jgi:hypothetical protein
MAQSDHHVCRFYSQAVSKPRKAGQQVTLEREPNNKHDKNAIKVILQPPSGQIGHVPKDTAKWLALLMDENRIRVTAELAFDAPENSAAKSIVVLVDVWRVGGTPEEKSDPLQVKDTSTFTCLKGEWFLCGVTKKFHSLHHTGT